MLMDIKCSMIPSIKTELVFDNGHRKVQVLGVGDLIDLLYNSNGLRKHIVGKIIQISTPGVDPKGWSMIVDGSDDFDSEVARLSPMSILDVDVIRKAGSVRAVTTPIDDTGIMGIRINHGRLQYTRDGRHWRNIKIDDVDVISKDDGIIDENEHGPRPPIPPSTGEDGNEDGGIVD
jgi:hypothetical protein